MEFTTLGKTGLRVGVAGLGCGGFSRLGLGVGKSPAEAVAIVRQALELGVNFIDTAALYGTEAVVGEGIRGWDRDGLVLSTKATVEDGDGVFPPQQVVADLDRSLKLLGIDCIDIFHLHGVSPGAYAYALEAIVPALEVEREKGKFKHLGITEVPPDDPDHETLVRAVAADCFEVVMVAHHMLNQSAERMIFPITRDKGIGVLIMFAVRVLFSAEGRLQKVVQKLVAEGRLAAEVDGADPLGFLVGAGGAESVIDAAYRYCRHVPGADVVLFGTGNPHHVRANVESILRPPLPAEDVTHLQEVFGALTGVGLDKPDYA